MAVNRLIEIDKSLSAEIALQPIVRRRVACALENFHVDERRNADGKRVGQQIPQKADMGAVAPTDIVNPDRCVYQVQCGQLPDGRSTL